MQKRLWNPTGYYPTNREWISRKANTFYRMPADCRNGKELLSVLFSIPVDRIVIRKNEKRLALCRPVPKSEVKEQLSEPVNIDEIAVKINAISRRVWGGFWPNQE